MAEYDEELRRQLAYYKRHLDELAAQRIAIEHHQWALQVEVRQKKKGFQLLSRLVRSFGAETDPSAMFRVAALAINSALEMDRTVVFVPSASRETYVASHIAGMTEADVQRVSADTFELPEELTASPEPLLVNRATPETPRIRRLRGVFGVETFLCVAVMGDREPLAVIFSGRSGGHAALYRAFDHGDDVDTFRAISSVLQAIAQQSRIARMEQVERLKADFYADVAHEFRTPLTLTLGPLAQILAGTWGPISDEVRARLEVVERNQGRLLGLVNEVLDLARLEAGANELRPAPIDDVNTLVIDCVDTFRPAAEARGLELLVALDPRLAGRALLVDREKLERALFNLLSNALKFTDRGHIDVSTRDDGECLSIVVADTGIGIPEDELPRVFERYRRMSGDHQRHTNGSGIGLALVKRMAALHDGDIAVESAKGKGARFTFTIPIRTPASSPPPASDAPRKPTPAPLDLGRVARDDAAAANRTAEKIFDPSKPVVLYVEDDADLRAHVRDTLADAYNLFLAGDGIEGLDCVRRYRPDAVLTDQMMPRMDGRQFLRALRADDDLASTPVVFLTAQYGIEGRIESLDAGADDYIGKPFHEAELRARIANLIRARKNERELAELSRRQGRQIRDQLFDLARAGELERFLPRAVVAAVKREPEGTKRAPTRRLVSVLVTELAALGAFGEHLSEAAAAALTDDSLAAVSSICTGHGGVIDALGGGRVSVLFGALEETPPEAAATAALAAANELREHAKRLDTDASRRGLVWRARRGIGIATGECIVGAFGGELLRTFTAVGGAVDAAATLHEGASSDEIACDDRTRALAGGVRVTARPAPPPGRVAVVAASRRPASGEPLLRREGEYWTVGYHGRVFRLRSSKGLDYLAHLLMRPHRELHVLQLANASAADERGDVRVVSSQEASELGLSIVAENGAPVLDRRAKKAYRARLDELDEQMRDGVSFSDPERVARAEMEREQLAHELASALGLGGRDRKASAAAERVRINVTRAIKAVLGKMAECDTELGRHLSTSVRTGMFCTYAPEPGGHEGWTIVL